MTNQTTAYRDHHNQALADPVGAMQYLNGVLLNYPEGFLKALGKVAQARQMTKVAQVSGVKREALYRALSDSGNPTFDTLLAVLSAVGLELRVLASGNEPPCAPLAPFTFSEEISEVSLQGSPEPSQDIAVSATRVPKPWWE